MTETSSKIYKISTTLEAAQVVLETSKLAQQIGFRASTQTLIATIASELARNMIIHASGGEMELSIISKEESVKGIEIIARDTGPGITDINQAMQENYSTKGTLGLGLPAVKRMADELDIRSEVGVGTIITVRKWINNGKS